MTKEKSQIEKFREAAKEAGTDESEAAFNERLKNLAQGVRLIRLGERSPRRAINPNSGVPLLLASLAAAAQAS
jgi:hypothetical protein